MSISTVQNNLSSDAHVAVQTNTCLTSTETRTQSNSSMAIASETRNYVCQREHYFNLRKHFQNLVLL